MDHERNALLESALTWAAWGVAVFPCVPGTKHPLTKQGFLDATTDETAIRLWWGSTPAANVAVVPGSAGYAVIDVDGEAGRRAADAFRKDNRIPDSGLVTASPGRGGGYHLWYKLPDPSAYVPSQYLTADKGLQVRAHGGYVMVAPSVHPDGPEYTLRRGTVGKTDLPVLPASVLREDASLSSRRSMAEVRDLLAAAPSRPTSYARKQVEQFAANLRDQAFAPEGERHALMLEFTYQLAAGLIGGRNTLDDARTLRDAYTDACEPWPVGSDFDSALYGALCKIERSADASAGRFRLVSGAETTLRRAAWLWDEKLPASDFSLLAGREGIGKSTITHWVAAQISRGTLPGCLRGTPKAVIYVSTEDSWPVKTAPCLAAAGADMSRVFHLEMAARNWITSVALPGDLAELSALAVEVDAALLVFDPLASRLDKGLDTHKDSDVKTALEPLLGFAQETGVAVLGLAHVNKSQTSDTSTSIMGSRAFVASPRAVLFAARVDGGGFGLSVVKSNYGPSNESTETYTLEKVPVQDGISGMRVVWNGLETETIDSLIKPQTGRGECRDWLETYLRGGPVMRQTATEAAKCAGFGLSTTERAAKMLDVVSVMRNGKAEWSLR